MSTPNKLEDDYRELDLEPGASLEEVKSSYRELALFWHPDQFHDRSPGAGFSTGRASRHASDPELYSDQQRRPEIQFGPPGRCRACVGEPIDPCRGQPLWHPHGIRQ